MIREVNGQFQLVSKKTGKVLGTHPTLGRALAQEKAIKTSKRKK